MIKNLQIGDADFDLSSAVDYHYGKFPPEAIDYGRLAPHIGAATAAIARYDGVLDSLINSEILLAPLINQEAVISSRIEGTVTTLDEVLEFEADQLEGLESSRRVRNETREVYSYTRALRRARREMESGLPLCERVIKIAHRNFLFFGRGSDKQPGQYKQEQNYIADHSTRNVQFVPIAPDQLVAAMQNLEAYINREDLEPITQTAISHLEFEAIHPFRDGNGRVGRMLITLMLWNKGLISQPCFYISAYLEKSRDDYVRLMRNVSAHDQWTEWCLFFMTAITEQAASNHAIAQDIQALYDDMKERFRETLSSQWSVAALDFIFANPVFRNNRLTRTAGIPSSTAIRFARLLVEAKLLRTIEPAAGRRPALYAFEPLLELVRV